MSLGAARKHALEQMAEALTDIAGSLLLPYLHGLRRTGMAEHEALYLVASLQRDIITGALDPKSLGDGPSY